MIGLLRQIRESHRLYLQIEMRMKYAHKIFFWYTPNRLLLYPIIYATFSNYIYCMLFLYYLTLGLPDSEEIFPLIKLVEVRIHSVNSCFWWKYLLQWSLRKGLNSFHAECWNTKEIVNINLNRKCITDLFRPEMDCGSMSTWLVDDGLKFG